MVRSPTPTPPAAHEFLEEQPSRPSRMATLRAEPEIFSDHYEEALRFLPEEAPLMEDERRSETMGGGLPRGKPL
jgi:hypothetical protein